MSEIELVFVVSDLHHGSTVGLCPPEVTLDGGGVYHYNLFQKWLWECWEDCTGCHWERKKRETKKDEMTGEICAPKRDGWMRQLAKRRPYAIVFLGDSIEGVHHDSVEIISSDVSVHAAIARQVCGALVEGATSVFMTRGTEVHVGTTESTLGQHVGGVYCKATKNFCWEQLQLRVNGILTHFKHHIGVSMRPWTTSMQYAAAIAAEQLNAVGLDHEPPRVIVRAHRHKFGEWSDEQGLVVVTPPWQQLTRHARKFTGGSLAQPGLVALDYADRDCYGNPRVHSKRYRPAPDEVIEL